MTNPPKVSRRKAITNALGWPVAAMAAMPAVVPPAQVRRGAGRIVVAYFSRTGNTRVIANQIRRVHGAELFEIRPATPYPEDYEATVRQAEQERKTGYEPPLAATVSGFDSCDVLFLGFPIWGTTMPSVVRSFLARHDTGGKLVVPFITHGGYGRGSSLDVLKAHAPRARLIEGFIIEADQERRTLEQVSAWLKGVALEK